MKAPAFQFYPGEFLVGTALFSNEEKGIYITLLCYQWEHGRLPEDAKKLAKLAGCKTALLSSILAKFTQDEDGTYFNERLDRERVKQADYREKQAVNGAKGGRPIREPKANPSLTQAFPLGSVLENPNHNPKKALHLQSSSSVNASTPKIGQRPATLEEAIAYGKSPHCGLTPELAKDCWNHYESMGWLVQGQPISDWQARFRVWKTKRGQFDQPPRRPGSAPSVPAAPARLSPMQQSVQNVKDALASSALFGSELHCATGFLRTLTPVAIAGFFTGAEQVKIAQLLEGK